MLRSTIVITSGEPMPQIRMPDGALVNFPDDMPREQIRAMIQKKFPDAPGHLDPATQFGKGEAQGVAGALSDITRYLPGDELPFLPESARQARRGARADVEKFAAEPGEGTAQNVGKFVGGAAPYMLGGEIGLPAAAARWAAERGAPGMVHAGIHILGHKLGIPHRLRDIVSTFIRTHPAFINAMEQHIRPAAGALGGALGGTAEATGRAIPGGMRGITREPDDEQRSRSPQTPRAAPVGPGDQAFRPGRGDRWQGGKRPSDNSAAD